MKYAAVALRAFVVDALGTDEETADGLLVKLVIGIQRLIRGVEADGVVEIHDVEGRGELCRVEVVDVDDLVHTAQVVCGDEWDRPYTREQAAYPAPWLRAHKFWPAVSRIDNVWGDRNLFCSCVPLGE